MRNRSKKIGSLLALLSFTAYMPVSCMSAFAADAVGANTMPNLNSAVNGSVSTSGNKMDVNINGGKGTVGQFDWNTFNVGRNSTVNWVFSANNQTALNRVLASGGMSYIYGKLTNSSALNADGSSCPACVNTGKVILINPSGILFGNGSSVNLNSFTASTYDIKGAKNLNSLSADQLKTYAGTGGTTGTLFNIAGYNKTVTFVPNDNMVNGNGYIKTDGTGTRLASIVADGSDIFANKSLGIVGNRVELKNGTKLKTTYSSTPNAANYKQTKSNIKIVTGDGVNFYYTSAANIDNNLSSTTAATKGTTQQYGVDIDNSQIRTGNLLIHNGVEKTNSSVDIKNGSVIYTKKLLGTSYTSGSNSYTAEETGTDGNILIESGNTVNIANSTIQTTNDDKNGSDITNGISQGHLTISGKNDVTIKNTQLRTANSRLNTSANNIVAGNISISSKAGNVTLKQDAATSDPNYNVTAILSAGNTKIEAAKDVTIDGYDKIQATGNNASSFTDRTINVKGKNVTAKNTTVYAKNLNVDSTNKIDSTNSTLYADNMKLLGTNTTLDNSLVQYKNLNFYEGTAKKNNVTIKNATTFNDMDTTALTISTNGNLTLDNANLKKQTYGSTSSTYQKGVTLESTTGNVTLQNNTDVRSANNFTINAKQGAVNINKSTALAGSGTMNVNAKNNIAISNSSTVWSKNGNNNLTSTAGKVTATNSAVAAEGGNTTISQALAMNIDNDFNASRIGATGKLTLKTDGSITGSTLAAGTGNINSYDNLFALNNDNLNIKLIYGSALMDAGQDISLSNLIAAEHVDFEADRNISLASTVAMTLDTVSLKAGGTSNVTATGNLLTKGLDIKGGTKTTLTGKTVKTDGNTVIKTNQNKLAVNSTGAVDIKVTGVTNANNGLEINADVNTSGGSAPLAGRTVKVNATDGTLAVSKIKADTLTLNADNIIAGKTTISSSKDNVSGLVKDGVDTSSKGYIEVKTDGGFNLDASNSYNDANKNMYTGGNHGTTSNSNTVYGDAYTEYTNVTTNTEKTQNHELISSNTVKDGEIGRVEHETAIGEPTVSEERVENVTGPNGEKGYNTITTTTQEYEVTADITYQTTTTKTYKDTETSVTTTNRTANTYKDYETTTNSRDTQHIATLNQNQKNGFVLVYGKNSTSSKTGKELVSSKQETIVGDPVTKVINSSRVETEKGTVTDRNIRQDNRVKTTTQTSFCEYEDDVPTDMSIDLAGNDVASWVKNPRHSEGTSNNAAIQKDLADTKTTMVAAAARLMEVNEEDTSDEDDDKDILK